MPILRNTMFAMIKFIFMIILLTFISPFLFDFNEDSMQELFQQMYVHADDETKDDFGYFIEDTLCGQTQNKTIVDFSSELNTFCHINDKDALCEQSASIEFVYQTQLCQIYASGELPVYCESISTKSSDFDLIGMCTSYTSGEIDAGEFFSIMTASELEIVAGDVVGDESLQNAALDVLHVPVLLRFENYGLWHRIILLSLLLICLYFLAGDVTTLTHKVGHVFLQTGVFLILYRIIISILTVVIGIDTSYLFDVLLQTQGAVPFSEIFASVFFSLFLLMHQIFYHPLYWITCSSMLVLAVLLYIPWYILKKRETRSEIISE